VDIHPTIALIISLTAVCVASTAGGAIAIRVRLGHRALQFALSAVAGVMLGVACFHMLPHAFMARGPAALVTHGGIEPVMIAAVLGFVVMFVLARFLDHHRHEPVESVGPEACGDGCAHDHGHGGHAPSRAHGAQGHAAGAHGADASPAMVSRGGWIGAFAGLGLHSALEGIAIAAAIELGAREGHGALAGFATVLVVLLHKPFDAMTLSTMLAAAGASTARRHAMNAVFAAIVPLGAAAFALGVRGDGAGILGLALAFSAGTFLCIAAADLLPELQFHSHDRLGLTASLVAGLGIAWGIGRLEAATHSHDHGAACTDPSHDHGHDHGHNHDHGHGEDHNHDHGDAPGH
jgi:zinc and cadmium transporter